MKIIQLTRSFVMTLALGVLSLTAQASVSVDTPEIAQLIKAQQKAWAKANYQLKDDEQSAAFKQLMSDSEQALSAHPKSAELWAWSGIIKSSFAGAEGGLSALSLVKAARKDFEKALELDANVLNGTTYASLGLLYHKVPGWPVAFGSDSKAEELFKKSMAINPDARESNYFYGEFLYDEGKYDEAKTHLLLAKNVPAEQWKDRPVAYEQRQQQIDEMLQKVDKRLAKRSRRRH